MWKYLCLGNSKVTKRLIDTNDIPIGVTNDNPALDTRVYEVEYIDEYKGSIATNELAINSFSQVDTEGNLYVLFDEIVDYWTDGTEIKANDSFMKSKNGVGA